MTPKHESGSRRSSPPNVAPEARVAMVTAAAHRCGKQLVHDLAVEGFDVAVCSLALLGSRVRSVESLGRRACAARLMTDDVHSAAFALNQVHQTLGRVHALIHLDADAAVGDGRTWDATTQVVMPDLIETGGTVVFLQDRPCAAAPRGPSGVSVIVLCASRAFASDRICRTLIGLLRRGVGGVYVQSNSASPGRVA